VEEAHYAEAVRGLRSRYDLALVTARRPATCGRGRSRCCRSGRTSHRTTRWPTGARPPWRSSPSTACSCSAPTARSRRLLDERLVDAGVAPQELLECSNPQVAQALAAAGRGVAVLSDDPRFDLVPLRIRTADGHLTLTLHAAWDGEHHAAEELARLAGRLRDFCAERYGDLGWVRR
jgi:DNA-binding transcriptional LysR family regulator